MCTFPVYHISPKTNVPTVLKDFSLTVKAATLIFMSGRGSSISSAKQGKSGFSTMFASMFIIK